MSPTEMTFIQISSASVWNDFCKRGRKTNAETANLNFSARAGFGDDEEAEEESEVDLSSSSNTVWGQWSLAPPLNACFLLLLSLIMTNINTPNEYKHHILEHQTLEHWTHSELVLTGIQKYRCNWLFKCLNCPFLAVLNAKCTLLIDHWWIRK